jgi:hypothetical protein
MKPTAFYILLILVLLSLALNVFIVMSLASARQAIVSGLDTSLTALSGLEGETFATTVQVKQAVPVRASVPFKRDLTVPIRINVPISQRVAFNDTIQIPIRTFVGEYSVSVPISSSIPIEMNVPISTQVPIAISETMPISTAINLDMAIPVSIRLADTPLVTYLRDLRTTLADIRDALSFGGK